MLLRFDLGRLQGLLRPPLIIFIVLVLGSCLAGFAVIQFTLAAHLTGDYLQLNNEYVEIAFPKHWIAFSWKSENVTAGESYDALFASPYLFSVMILRLYGEEATQTFMEEHNLTDAFSVVISEVNSIYEWSQANNENATLHFLENGTRTVSNHRADYTKFRIRDGLLSDDVLHNVGGTIMSYMANQKLVQIVFWGEENDYNQTYNIFETILDSTKVKAGE